MIISEIEKNREVQKTLEFRIRRLTIEIEEGGKREHQERIEEVHRLISEKEVEIRSVSVSIEDNQELIVRFE